MNDFDDSFFDKSEARIAALQARLSQDALEGIAREAVRRLAERDSRLGGTDPEHPVAADIATLVAALINRDQARARVKMQWLQAQGLTLDVLYGRYLAPAAALLGQMWEQDRLSFAEVTMGAGRIFELVRMLRDALPPTRITRNAPVLFATVPGEQHGIGIEMAAELFRQHGWDVRLMIGADHDTIMAEIGQVACVVLGLSSGGRASAAALAQLVHAVRVTYPEVYLMLSGRVVTEDPGLISAMQPDTAIANVEDALAVIEALSGEAVR
ncbi:cobalamin-dependent protein [Thalassococcus sp. CAU 1522]|uniref:Cobalamin-dependent protein n=1 Tax=Thalassococcus arenae TaxID=2851652 RepID=A0ABS6N4H0_9RHOB|nr:cobalamin-dependent protein [Thalassococcus arenae]MBV2358913.1 cobalamin-dependent protein [Thalassococcus arenae]